MASPGGQKAIPNNRIRSRRSSCCQGRPLPHLTTGACSQWQLRRYVPMRGCMYLGTDLRRYLGTHCLSPTPPIASAVLFSLSVDCARGDAHFGTLDCCIGIHPIVAWSSTSPCLGTYCLTHGSKWGTYHVLGHAFGLQVGTVLFVF